MMFVLFNTNTPGVSCGTGTTYPSGAPEFLSGVQWARVVRSFSFCVVFCSSWFVFVFVFVFLFLLFFHFSFGHFSCILRPSIYFLITFLVSLNASYHIYLALGINFKFSFLIIIWKHDPPIMNDEIPILQEQYINIIVLICDTHLGT